MKALQAEAILWRGLSRNEEETHAKMKTCVLHARFLHFRAIRKFGRRRCNGEVDQLILDRPVESERCGGHPSVPMNLVCDAGRVCMFTSK